jgi:hypothetical protein
VTKLRIADNLSLPLEAVTQAFAVLAKRGAGKTYLASVLAEEMLKAGQQAVIVDPTGAWWGLRSSADGKGPGFPIVVMGGNHGDLPLEEHAGEVIAAALVENRFSAVLDLSLFRKGQLIRFMVTFAETLYRLNREALHLFVDEADAVAPQGRNYGGEENRMLGAMEDIVRRGRLRGIGCTLLTQRPAVLNKNVLTQCESLFALRMVHPKDIDAIAEWVNVHADPGEATEVIDSLPSLPVGTAWFWSPGWIGTLKKVQVRARETFDSSATPKPGEKARTPKHLAEIDLDALGERIRATVERAKENDPRELRRQLADLRRQLQAKPAGAPDPQALERAAAQARQQAERAWADERHRLEREAAGLRAKLREIAGLAAVEPPAPRREVPAEPVRVPPAPRPAKAHREADAKLAGGERRILAALAQHPQGRTKVQVALLTGYAHSGGGFSNYLSSLRTRGFIEGSGDNLRATDAGLDALGPFDPLPTGRALFELWLGQLGKAEREALQVLYDAYPEALSKEEVARRTPSGYAPDGGGFANALSRLRTLELIQGRGELRASDTLFQE